MELIEIIKQKLTIRELLSFYNVPIRNKSFQCTHVYHEDSNPSAVISADGNGYWCNACGEGGNVIHLYRRGIKSGRILDFKQAVEQIQEDFKIDLNLPNFEVKQTVENELYKIITLPENEKIGTEYLKARGLRNTMQVGYMPLNLRFKDDETNKEYNLLKGRIVFPIRDVNGVLVGFSGRAANWKKGDKFPKYQNTSRYKKEATLHGLHIAKHDAKALGWLGMVEGYTDVIAAHLTKRMNFVSYSSASVTKLQAESLNDIKGIEFVVLFTDGDKASEEALKKNVTNILSAGLYPRVFFTEKGQDPCDFFLNNKTANILHLAKECWDLFSYNEMWQGISNLKPIYRTMALKKAAITLGEDEKLLQKMFYTWLKSKTA